MFMVWIVGFCFLGYDLLFGFVFSFLLFCGFLLFEYFELLFCFNLKKYVYLFLDGLFDF